MAYLNSQGGNTQKCNTIAPDIWLWCYENNNWITACHLPGVLNTQADLESRSIHDNMEWKLHLILFNKICVKWGIPEIDLFANRLNNQLDRYISWKPDPGAMAVDAFALDWHKIKFYAFPPFNMIGRGAPKGGR